jgi:hypothetical protein
MSLALLISAHLQGEGIGKPNAAFVPPVPPAHDTDVKRPREGNEMKPHEDLSVGN